MFLLDALSVVGAVLPWIHRMQVRRLERFGAGIPFAARTRQAIDRAGRIAMERGDRAVAPVHLALAVLEQAERDDTAAAASRAHSPADAHGYEPTPSLMYEYAGFVVLAESCRIAHAEHDHEVTPRHLLLGVLRKRTRAASRLLAERGITAERLAHGGLAAEREVSLDPLDAGRNRSPHQSGTIRDRRG